MNIPPKSGKNYHDGKIALTLKFPLLSLLLYSLSLMLLAPTASAVDVFFESQIVNEREQYDGFDEYDEEQLETYLEVCQPTTSVVVVCVQASDTRSIYSDEYKDTRVGVGIKIQWSTDK